MESILITRIIAEKAAYSPPYYCILLLQTIYSIQTACPVEFPYDTVFHRWSVFSTSNSDIDHILGMCEVTVSLGIGLLLSNIFFLYRNGKEADQATEKALQ